MPRDDEKPSTEARKIFDALRDPEYTNIEFNPGEYMGEKVSYVVKIDKNDKAVPIALILTKKTRKLLDTIAHDLEQAALEGEDGDDLDEETDEDDRDEKPARSRGKRL